MESSIIEISNANMRNGELHLSSFADIKISNEKLKSDKKSGILSRFLHFYAAIPAKARDKTSGYISRKFS